MEENRDTITYDDNWQSVTEPETPVIAPPARDDGEEEAAPRPHTPRQLLLTVQLVLCLLLALAAYILKSVGGETYRAARQWYDDALNSSAVFDAREGFDLSTLLGAATADEA